MKIKEMRASFGPLQRAVLCPGDGLTVIQAANESGKSTWCAFLRAMLYGFPARDRDKAGYLAEKNRYQPWSGAAMEGTLTLEWQGRDITLYRGPKGSVPWGSFRAVWTASQEPVEALTGDNCGQVLLGVSREVFERTAFVGQGEIVLSPSADLEKRISALAASGQEDVSFSQVEQRLKTWLNRRKVNSRVGLIPSLEKELEQINASLQQQGSVLRQLQQARQEKEEMEGRKARLEEQLQAHSAALRARQSQQRRQAQDDYEAALSDFRTAEKTAQALPPAEELRQAQGELSYLNTLTANLRMAEKAVPQAREAAQKARDTAQADPYFPGLDAVQAAAQAQRDHDELFRLQKRRGSPLSLLGAPVGAVLGIALSRISQHQSYSIPILILGALIGWAIVALPMFWMGKGRQKRADALLAQYGAQTPEDILQRSAQYAQKVSDAQEAERALRAVEGERDKLLAQKEELTEQLLDFVHPFAGEVTDLFGVSAALSRALQQGEALALARSRLESAEKLLSALPVPGPGEDAPAPAIAPEGDFTLLSAQLGAVNETLSQAIAAAARLQGELDSLGDRQELEARRDALTGELEHRREEYDAIAAAMEALTAADSLLRERFSPAVNDRAGAYLSRLTGGRYRRASLTRQFQALAQEEGEALPRQDLALSGGAAQQLYLALRLAMCDLVLPREEPCPILLDDVLDSFDDGRAQLALECLLEMARERQVILFTCHSRERAMLSGRQAVVLTLDEERG